MHVPWLMVIGYADIGAIVSRTNIMVFLIKFFGNKNSYTAVGGRKVFGEHWSCSFSLKNGKDSLFAKRKGECVE